MAKKSNVFVEGMQMDTIVETVTDLGYSYLESSDFRNTKSTYQTMSKIPYRCYRILSRTVNFKTLEEMDIWNPDGKIFCEIYFDSEGLSNKSYITIGKNTYTGEKALELIDKKLGEIKKWT